MRQRSDEATPGRPGGGPRRRRIPTALLVLAGLAAGIGGAVAVPRLLDGDDDPADTAVVQPADRPADQGAEPADTPTGGTEAPEGAGASSPEAAITGFLDAEVAGELTTSFGYLSEDDRALYASPAGWVAAHADVLPRVVGYELEPVASGAPAQASAASTVTFEPGLDQVIGLVPERARVTWDVRQAADGSWGVALGDTTTIEPLYPSEAGVAPAADQWLQARQRCETPDNEFAGLLGPPQLAERLCGSDGDLSTGEPAPLGDVETNAFATAFGPETAEIARLVRVSGPVELGAVLVPIGDAWTVIGVVP